MIELSNFRSFFVANWKLNGNFQFIRQYLEILNREIFNKKCVVLCPPSIYLNIVKDLSKDSLIGAQDCSFYNEGAYTGEISANMLSDIGVNFCIVGHSERRKYFRESNDIINEKASKLIENNIVPIICIGETLDEKKNNRTEEILKVQVAASIPKSANNNNSIIAYEPVWAIGTGITPTLKEIEDSHKFIRNLDKKFLNFKMLYGGSVNIKNSKQILNLANVNGALIGGASLKIDEFIEIINNSS